MIELCIGEYCQNCKLFYPDLERIELFDGNVINRVCCERQDMCGYLCKRLRDEIGEKE